MKLKHLTGMGVALNIMLIATSANAFSSYLTDVNKVYGSKYTNCLVCHSTAGGGTDKGVTAYANMYRASHSAATVRNQDADADGYTNGQEASVNADMSNTTSSPFTLAKTAESSTSTKVVVSGAGIVTEAAITDIYTQAGLTLTTGHSIAGGVSPLINTFPATITFNQAVNTGDKVYVVDLATKTNTLVTTGVTFNANGSVTVNGLTGPLNIVVDRVTPTVSATNTTVPVTTTTSGNENDTDNENDSENDGSSSTAVGCVTAEPSTPLLMFLVMISLVFIVRRKNS